MNRAYRTGLLARLLKPGFQKRVAGVDATRRRASLGAFSPPPHQGVPPESGHPSLFPFLRAKILHRKNIGSLVLCLAGASVLLVAMTTSYLWMSRMQFDKKMARVWAELRKPEGMQRFDPGTIRYLPNPARRYFLHAIGPGTLLAKSVILEMEGRMGSSPDAEKIAMTGREIMASPRGFVWKARFEDDIRPLSGYDFYVARDSGIRRWLWGFIPVSNVDGPERSRSAAGRVALDAMWLPSALLPVEGDEWQPVDDWSARVRVRVDGEVLVSTLYVSPEGQLERLETMRWDPKGLNGTSGNILWVADQFTEERTFGGYTIPVRLRVTSMAGSSKENTVFEPVIVTAEYK